MKTYFTISSYYGKNAVYMFDELCRKFNLNVTELNNGWYSADKEAFDILHWDNLALGGYTSKPQAA